MVTASLVYVKGPTEEYETYEIINMGVSLELYISKYTVIKSQYDVDEYNIRKSACYPRYTSIQ